MRIAINGMGRIGRLLFRRLINHDDITIVAVNDIMEPANLCYLLKYDSLFGTFPAPIHLEGNSITTGSKRMIALQCSDPLKLPWKSLDVDLVLECSGKFIDKESASGHLYSGAKKVLLSTTSPNIPLKIFGYNHETISPEDSIISPGGCMTNCSTHVLNTLNLFGIESAQIHILHSYTSRQELVDSAHSQYRRGRAAAESIIPVEIDLAHSLEKILPLRNKISALSTRVPVTNGALGDFTVQLKKIVTREEVNNLFRTLSETKYKGIMDYTEDQVVSADIKGNTHSCVIDGTLTSVIGNQVKVIAWFDNEFGFTSRMIDWLKIL